ncbi:hypothetical protein M0811_14680 [Anaeramoeba ignava]|uniref:Uncharacterized protein n=1 Tax=Anaeramoeba ignava TaxID=1746090 RepID=A0A9Q0RGA7_ANAIG|nr:hypothetical protein M0811_14680 [Anaeramoeba ignava]
MILMVILLIKLWFLNKFIMLCLSSSLISFRFIKIMIFIFIVLSYCDGLTDPYSQMNYSYYSYTTGLIGVNEYPIIHEKLECKKFNKNESWHLATACMLSLWDEIVNTCQEMQIMYELTNFMESKFNKRSFLELILIQLGIIVMDLQFIIYMTISLNQLNQNLKLFLANGTKIFIIYWSI